MRMKECTFMKVVKQKSSIKYVQDCGICLNCLYNLAKIRGKKNE